MEGSVPKHFSEKQKQAALDVMTQLNNLWEKTATRERKVRLQALKMFVANLASGKAAWRVSAEERALGEHLVELKLSQWLSMWIDDDGVEHVMLYSYPDAWMDRPRRDEPVEAPLEARPRREPDEIGRLVNSVRGIDSDEE